MFHEQNWLWHAANVSWHSWRIPVSPIYKRKVVSEVAEVGIFPRDQVIRTSVSLLHVGVHIAGTFQIPPAKHLSRCSFIAFFSTVGYYNDESKWYEQIEFDIFFSIFSSGVTQGKIQLVKHIQIRKSAHDCVDVSKRRKCLGTWKLWKAWSFEVLI